MYKFSGYPEANLSFAEYIRANHATQFIQVNNCIIFPSLAIFIQVAKEEELTPQPADKVQQFKQIAYIFPTGEAITA
jgi:hypothetical protein